MAYHNDLFPTDISYGSRGGPGYFTSIIELDSGVEERVSRRSKARRQYDASYGVKRYSQLAALAKFYIARKGSANSFPYKDWFDFTSAEVGKEVSAFTDQTIGTGDGTNVAFQLVKRYQSGAQTEVRKITKTKVDSVTIAVNGTLASSGWTVDNETGIVTFSVAPTSGHVVTAGFNFYVPVRFGAEADGSLFVSLENFSTGSIEALPLIEVLDEDQYEDDFLYGGAEEHGNVSADFSISQPNGRTQSFDPQSGSLIIYLPAKSTVKPGGPIFYLHNLSLSNTIAIKEAVSDGGATVIAAMAADSAATVDLSVDNPETTRTWYVF